MKRRRIAALTGAVLALTCPATALAEDAPFVSWADLLPALSTGGFEPTSEDDCTAGRVQCVEKVIRVMDRHLDELATSCHHNSIFALSYLRTTEEYLRATTTPGFFSDPAFVNHEDAVFARFYFDAYSDWSENRRAEVPEAWLVAFDAAQNRQVTAGTNLSLGINAHVNRDLPYVLAGIGLVKPDGTSRKADHDKVNEFLNRVTDGLFAEGARRFDPTFDDNDVPGIAADGTALFQLIASWREGAWRNAERLANAPSPEARAQVAREIEAYAAQTARSLRDTGRYTPLSSFTASQRDAYCAAHHADA